MTRDMWTNSILPIGVLFSGSLILSNVAYLTLSVSFIQMLKVRPSHPFPWIRIIDISRLQAFTPVAILLISFMFGLAEMNQKLLLIVFLISAGVSLASYGELQFQLFGFVCQVAAVGFESARLVMIQILLQGLKMDPLISLYYFAPVCAAINGVLIFVIEGFAPFEHFMRIGPLVLLTNAGVAFMLNVSAVFLIGAAGGLVLTLAGVFKDIVSRL